jgi:hypothetical protein
VQVRDVGQARDGTPRRLHLSGNRGLDQVGADRVRLALYLDDRVIGRERPAPLDGPGIETALEGERRIN